MTENNLNHILLKDTPYYNSRAPYVRVFNSKNLTNVAELLEACKDENFFKGFNLSTVISTKGFISIIGYKYANIPSKFIPLMDEKIDFEGCYPGIIRLKNDDNMCIYTAELFGGPVDKVSTLLDQFKAEVYLEVLNSNGTTQDMNNRVIDFLKWIARMENAHHKHLIRYAETYVEAYEKYKSVISNKKDDESASRIGIRK